MPKIDLKELGRTGLDYAGGNVNEEFLRELTGQRWRKILREMTTNDPVVASVLFAVEMLVRQVTWDIAPASEANEDLQNADFIRGALFEDMSATWQDTLSEILSFLPHGYSFLEIVYKERQGESNDPSRRSAFTDGRTGWRKWAVRSQDSLDRWDFDDAGGVQAFVQLPPDYIERVIPITKGLLFRTTSHKGNPEGRSIFRSAYRPWYFKKHIENIEGVGIERDLAGLPVIGCPPELLSADASAEDKAILGILQKLVASIKRDEQEGVVFPLAYDEKGNKLYDLTLLTSGGKRQFDTNAIIQRYDQRILMASLADFLLLGSGKVGSFALSSDKTNLFSVALGAWLDSICDVVNRHAIPRLSRLNALRGGIPKLTHGKVEAVDLEELGNYISKLSGAGVTLSPEQQAHLLKQANIPVVEDADELSRDEPDSKQTDDSEDEDDE